MSWWDWIRGRDVAQAATAGGAKSSSGQISGVSEPQSWLVGAVGGGPTASGLRVSPDDALRVSTVLAAVRILTEDIAKMPLKLIRVDGARESEARDHPLWRILTKQPNSWQSPFEFKEFLVANLILRGNGYAWLDYDDRGRLRQIVPIKAQSTTVLESPDDGRLFYQVSRDGVHMQAQLREAPLIIPQREMVHVRSLSTDGVVGLSLVGLLREAVGLSLATERHGAKMFGNGARLSGVIQHPAEMSEGAYKRLRHSFEEAYSGIDNAMKTAILEEGAKFEAISMSADDAQFLETRSFQVIDLARGLRIPPHKMMVLDRAIKANIEHQALEYLSDTLQPWMERIESALERDLLTAEERDNYKIQFDASRLLRTDIKARYEAYSIGLQWGFLSVNDVRVQEGMDPVENGDQHLQPLNMAPIGSPPAEQIGRSMNDILRKFHELEKGPENGH